MANAEVETAAAAALELVEEEEDKKGSPPPPSPPSPPPVASEDAGAGAGMRLSVKSAGEGDQREDAGDAADSGGRRQMSPDDGGE